MTFGIRQQDTQSRIEAIQQEIRRENKLPLSDQEFLFRTARSSIFIERHLSILTLTEGTSFGLVEKDKLINLIESLAIKSKSLESKIYLNELASLFKLPVPTQVGRGASTVALKDVNDQSLTSAERVQFSKFLGLPTIADRQLAARMMISKNGMRSSDSKWVLARFRQQSSESKGGYRKYWDCVGRIFCSRNYK